MKGIAINDLHFGIQDSARLYDELQFFKEYLRNSDAELLVLDGDYFDHKLSIGDQATYFAISFFNELLDIVKDKKMILRIVQGTRSHDLNQLQLFKPILAATDIDYKIFETVAEEDLLGMHILYIPEEYPEDVESFYAPYKAQGKEYNIIFGHGMWDFVAPPGTIANSKRDTHSAPVFIWKEWKNTVPNGFVSFGHIHGRNTYGSKIYYSGSYTAWSYGERSAKGFTEFEYDTEKKTYSVKYIDNEKAPKYEVMSVAELEIDLANTDAGTIQALLTERANQTDNLRIDLAGLSKDKIDAIRNAFSSNPHVKIEVRENSAMLKESAEKKDYSKWQYIVKRQLPLDKTIQRYLLEECKVNMTLDNIDKILKKDA